MVFMVCDSFFNAYGRSTSVVDYPGISNIKQGLMYKDSKLSFWNFNCTVQ